MSDNDKYQIITPLYTQISYLPQAQNNGHGSQHLHKIKRDFNIIYILIISFLCCIPSVMFEVRYTGVDRAAGYRGMLVQARSDQLRINIHDSKPNPLG
jgi:hypothetical protein